MEAGSTKGVTARAACTAADIRSARRALPGASMRVAEIHPRAIMQAGEIRQVTTGSTRRNVGRSKVSFLASRGNTNAAMGNGDGREEDERGESDAHHGNLT